MHDAPAYPPIDDAPDVLSGHLWLQERVDGTPLRFQVRDAAPIRFGDGTRTFEADDAPRDLRYAIHELQRRLDRQALRNAVDDVESITFVGVATHREQVDYDWRRLPGFLGMDIWNGNGDANADGDADGGGHTNDGEWLPPDRAEQVFDSLDLTPLTTIQKEVRAADFHPDRYDFPDSSWRDGTVAGVIVRNKTGGRAVLANPAVQLGNGGGDGGVDATEATLYIDHEESPADRAVAVADGLATDALFGRLADEIETDDARTLTFDALQTAVLDAIYREHAPTFEQFSVDHDALRQAVAGRTSQYLGRHA